MTMRLPELLAPAGSLEALAAALAAGADAVYTGAGAFNARAAATDLTLDELRRAAALCRAYGARLYVTLNIFVHDGELGPAAALARGVLGAGADALIVADPGLIAAIRREVGDVEIHLSTQAGVHAPAGAVLAARELGVTRVTCGRELSVSEIAAMAATGVEIEAFCHGAICICYAGACSFSSLRRGRSANRGDCTQPCRLHYGLVDEAGVRLDAREGDLLLCPRDYLSIRHIPELVRSGVGALKIEGRMKNPDYVYNVVRCYRRALDGAAAGLAVDIDGLEAQLARSFNRGFSTEYLQGASGSELMSWERSCNQGLRAGVVVERRHEEVVVELERAVDEGDTLEIRYIPGEEAASDVPKRWPMVPCPVSASAGERIAVHCKRKVSCGSVVHVVRSAGVLAQAAAAVDRVLSQPVAVEAVDARTEAGSVGSEAVGVGTEAVDARSEAGAAGAVPDAAPAPAARASAAARAVSSRRLPTDCVLTGTVDAARAAIDGGAEAYVHAFRILEDGIEAWGELLPSVTAVLDEVSRADDEAFQRELCRRARSVACRNLTQLAFAREAGARFEVAPPVIVSNASTLSVFAGLGASRVWLPCDLALERVEELAASAGGACAPGVVIQGRPELMVTEHCLLTAEGSCSGRCAECRRRASRRFLVERDGTRLPVFVDARGRTRIFDADPIGLTDARDALEHAGVAAFLRAPRGAPAW